MRAQPVGVVIAALVAIAAIALPFIELKPNRIASGQGLVLWHALPAGMSVTLMAALTGMAVLVLLSRRLWPVLLAALGSAALLAVALGQSAAMLAPAGAGFARVSQASGFWLLLLACGLTAADCLARMKASPAMRLVLLAACLAASAAILSSGALDRLAVMREFAGRDARFWQEGRQHLFLVAGSLAPALLIGIPLGAWASAHAGVRQALLRILNIIQTIPSIALFALLLTPLALLAAASPLLAGLGIRGIGAAPAILALFLYALLPVTANTMAGLTQVAPAVIEAARGMGMTRLQILWSVRFPLASPAIIGGVRIALVQNIGLAAVAALIGGGGFGTFIFTGMGQTAIDLVLLGAVPIVVLAFTAALVLDGLSEMLRGSTA